MYSSILVPIDLEEPSSWKKSVPVGIGLAQAFGARVTLATVVPDNVAGRAAQWSAIGYRRLLDTANARLDLLAAELGGGTELESRVGSGPIAKGILGLAQDSAADLIVLASHRPEMKDWLIGANASRVVRHAACSVMVVRN